MNENKIKGSLGFGCMRLPMLDGEVDTAAFSAMVDEFIASGFNYFDTAHGYLDGKSETAIRTCLSSRYPRDSFVLANKLSYWYIKSGEDVRPLFELQCERCGVDYFDYYLMHALNRERYEAFKSWDAFRTVSELKSEGRIAHLGMSFHDSAEVLDMILTEQPDIEFVQLQINYLDYDDPNVQSKRCYDVAVKHGKRVIVMEPVKGGTLVNLPKAAAELLDSLGGGSYASYALRYAHDFPEVFMVLSGMGSMEMVRDNVATMSAPKPLTEKEHGALTRARAIIREARQIPCTACRYCTEVCPIGIPIPEIFKAMNLHLSATLTRKDAGARLPGGVGAADCIGCGACERVCPQGIGIRDDLARVKREIMG